MTDANGSVWITSPRELSRTTRIFRSWTDSAFGLWVRTGPIDVILKPIQRCGTLSIHCGTSASRTRQNEYGTKASTKLVPGSNVNRRRIGILTDGLVERRVGGATRIANGGVGVYIYQLIRHLFEDDHGNEYFLIRFGEGALDIYRHPRAHCIWLPLRRWNPLQRAFDLPYARLARELELDLLHFPNQFGGAFLPSSICRVATLHDLTPILFPHTHPARRVIVNRLLARRALRKCNRVIVPSEATRADAVRMGFASADRISTIPLGVREIFKPSVRTGHFEKKYGLERSFMLNVGVLEPRKNQTLLFDVLRRIRESGKDLDLVIIGREGWRWTNPLELPQNAAIKPYVHIFRDVPEDALLEFYGRAAVFVYPSLYEG